MVTKAQIVECARTYIDTPFHHRGRQPGLALDCAGVLVCDAREMGVVAPDFDVPAYLAQPDGRTLIAWCRQYLGEEVTKDEMEPGDVVVFVADAYPQHLGIVGNYLYGRLSVIHASNVSRPPRVIETRLMFTRVMRFTAAFEFPGIE